MIEALEDEGFWNSGRKLGDARRDFRIEPKHESSNFNDTLEGPDPGELFKGFEQVCKNMKRSIIRLLVKDTVVLNFALMLSFVMKWIHCIAS